MVQIIGLGIAIFPLEVISKKIDLFKLERMLISYLWDALNSHLPSILDES
jgi:hypothetical protein